MNRLVLYVHGQGGNAEEAKHYQPLLPDWEVIGFDYQAQNPWEARREFSDFFDSHSEGRESVVLIANSIGAFFAMSALSGKRIAQALFISPIVNMEKLIGDMMLRANVTEAELQRRREIPTSFGETLSWEYLRYVRTHPLQWAIPTCVLYGGRDCLTSRETISEFSERIGAALTVMEDGEHWFHTDAQMRFLDDWVRTALG